LDPHSPGHCTFTLFFSSIIFLFEVLTDEKILVPINFFILGLNGVTPPDHSPQQPSRVHQKGAASLAVLEMTIFPSFAALC